MKQAYTIENTHHESNIQGARIFTYASGQGMPVLLLHGAPDSHEMWLPLIAHLKDHARCFAPDLPGFGQSTLPADFALTLDNMADFVRDLVVALGIDEPVTLVTTDFGGHYGMAFMVKYPHLVRGIAISNTNFFHDYQWHFFARLYRIPVVGEFILAATPRSMMRQTMKKVSPALSESYIDSAYDSGFGSAAVRRTILRMYRARAPQDFIAWEDRLLAVLAEKPAIVLWGDQDPFISPAYADRFGNAEVHHFTAYSHWLPLEAPATYADALLPWLQKL